VTDTIGFGIDAFTLDDRMRLFHFLAADNRFAYLWVLRAFDRGRANYQVLLHTSDVAELLDQLAVEHPDCPRGLDVPRLLDALVEWGNLDRSQDGARATTIHEYRNRHSVYQFTDAGYRAYQSVEQVLAARLDEANLSRLVFADILVDLDALAAANEAGDAEEVYRKLSRLDRALSDMAERAARFYLMLGDLARTNDTRPEIFLAHKDALLTHMRDFQSELARYTPRLRAAIDRVADSGVEILLEHAAEADERLFRSPAERLDDWRARWQGLVGWFRPEGRRSEADRLTDATVTAISDVLALLRRVTEARRGGVSRESQLRHLAAWFAGVPSDYAAHALFQVAFNLRAPRHVSIAHPDPERISSRRSWWDADAVEVSRTLVETGRPPAPGGAATLNRNEAARERLRERQVAEQQARCSAGIALADGGVYDRRLGEAETAMLFTLLDRALGARVPVTGRVRSSGAGYGVRLTIEPCPGHTTVDTVRGRLHLDGVRLLVRRLDAPAPHAEPSRRAPGAAREEPRLLAEVTG
jgi:uncharacterized protein (TIGR02677 family)